MRLPLTSMCLRLASGALVTDEGKCRVEAQSYDVEGKVFMQKARKAAAGQLCDDLFYIWFSDRGSVTHFAGSA